MPSVRCSLGLLAMMLMSATPIEPCVGGDPAGAVNRATNSLEGVVLFTATVSQQTRASEPVFLSLQLKNLSKELLVVNDRALDTFVLKLRTKDGAVVRTTRYLEDMIRPNKPGKPGAPDVVRTRDVNVELTPGQSSSVTLPLHRIYDLSLHGDYVISIEARYTVNRIGAKIAVQNLPFTIRHVPFVRITESK